MENLTHVGLMSCYYTQLYIVSLCHFKMMLFKLGKALGSYKSGK